MHVAARIDDFEKVLADAHAPNQAGQPSRGAVDNERRSHIGTVKVDAHVTRRHVLLHRDANQSIAAADRVRTAREYLDRVLPVAVVPADAVVRDLCEHRRGRKQRCERHP